MLMNLDRKFCVKFGDELLIFVIFYFILTKLLFCKGVHPLSSEKKSLDLKKSFGDFLVGCLWSDFSEPLSQNSASLVRNYCFFFKIAISQ